ncbi:uncharacterized protein VTP21DRAFT_6171 [Calcarisporiella thermophila]|uniref:uncharacterized protein n=1 Tax=Calcarisporiella thermophila TaxID=911321 RepID=UPI0037424C39
MDVFVLDIDFYYQQAWSVLLYGILGTFLFRNLYLSVLLLFKKRTFLTIMCLLMAVFTSMHCFSVMMAYFGIVADCKYIGPLVVIVFYLINLCSGIILVRKAMAIHPLRCRLVLAADIVFELLTLAAYIHRYLALTPITSPYKSCYPRYEGNPLAYTVAADVSKYAFFTLLFIIPLWQHTRNLQNKLVNRLLREGILYFLAISITDVATSLIIYYFISRPIITILHLVASKFTALTSNLRMEFIHLSQLVILKLA